MTGSANSSYTAARAAAVIALLAGLIAMHGFAGLRLSGEVFRGMPASHAPMSQAVTATPMSASHAGVRSLPTSEADGPYIPAHHSPGIAAQPPCLFTLTSSLPLIAPPVAWAHQYADERPTLSEGSSPPGRAMRAPPDRYDLCISRT